MKVWTSDVCDEDRLKLKPDHIPSDAFGDMIQRVGVRRATKLVASISNPKLSHWTKIFGDGETRRGCELRNFRIRRLGQNMIYRKR